MYWCYTCETNGICPNSCSACHSQAIEEVTTSSPPQDFKPYLIEQKEEAYYSFDSLYRSVYGNLFEAARERRPQQVRRVTSNGDYEISYILVLDAAEEDQVRGLTER